MLDIRHILMHGSDLHSKIFETTLNIQILVRDFIYNYDSL